jgi:farnesyl diphosphate synthase
MDNDDYRRGKLSCHRAFDESTAILVGDGLQTLAIDVLLTQLPATVSAEQTIRIAGELTDACGPSGMLSGQGLDLILLSKPGLTEQELTHIHQLKTGRLILACINMVLIASHAPHAEEVALRQFATQFGLLFQMQDDYLDQYDEIAHLGKKRASDLSNQKFTFASFMSKEALFERLSTEFENTLLALRCFEHRAKKLRQFIQNVFMRSHSSTLIDQND